MFFHLPCLNYKCLPNNHKTTWVCFSCMTKKSFGKNANPKHSNKTDEGNSIEIDEILDTVDQLLGTGDADDLLLVNATAVTNPSVEKKAPLATLTHKHFGIIESDTGKFTYSFSRSCESVSFISAY